MSEQQSRTRMTLAQNTAHKQLFCARLFDGQDFFDRVLLDIEAGKIVGFQANIASVPPQAHRLSGLIAPGFIDLQVNGGGGVLLNNQPNIDGIKQIIRAHHSKGTTALMATLMSDTSAVCTRLVEQVSAQGASVEGLLGLHIEGPFFAPQRNGAHALELIRKPDPAQDSAWLDGLARLREQGLVGLLTCAAEVFPLDWLARLTQDGLEVAIGHSEASFAQSLKAFEAGARGVTHLFNAMPALVNRAPGVVGASLSRQNSWASIICDGHHVDSANIALAAKLKQDDDLLLVSDAMATVGSSPVNAKDNAQQQRSFLLYGERLTEKDGKLLNSQGRLAGSAIGMVDAVKFAIEQVGLPQERVLRMASLYPARAMGGVCESERGLLRTGYRADFVALDKAWHLQQTWVSGRCVYDRDKEQSCT